MSSAATPQVHHLGRLVARLDVDPLQQSKVARAALIDRILPMVLCCAFALSVALSLAASPRRSGDAHQYVALAIQLSQLRPPSLSPGEEAAYREWLATQPPSSGFPDGALAVRQPALIRDGRQEFSHFWLYPLLAAPATAIATAVGAHPMAAFGVTDHAARFTFEGRIGYGIFEHGSFGRHDPSGFADHTSTAR